MIQWRVADVYACSCHAVRDQIVRTAIAAGATTVEEIGDRCGAGTGCGGCRILLERLLRQAAVGVEIRHVAA